jgi:hypothetical protein
VILALQPLNPSKEMRLEDDRPLKLTVSIKSKNRYNINRLIRVLVSVCGAAVDLIEKPESGIFELTVEGEPSPYEIEMSANILAPEIAEFFDPNAVWEGGVSGIISLVILSYMGDVLRKFQER